MRYFLLFSLMAVLASACTKHCECVTPNDRVSIRAADLSAYPEVMETQPVFYNAQNQPQSLLDILKQSGINTIRLRLWVSPATAHIGWDEVTAFSQTLRAKGFKIWLDLHYSDTWADPGHQETPAWWQGIPFATLQDSVAQYTRRAMLQFQPEYIQIGNEINNGLLHPAGNRYSQPQQYIALLETAIQAVKEQNTETQIMLHYAGLNGATAFFEEVHHLDYDLIGLSYYPIWHGTDLQVLQQTLQNLTNQNSKPVVIAETAYPFTLGWNDWTNNIVGLDEHLILPDFPATPQGQRAFLKNLLSILQATQDYGSGLAYWGGELIAWKGATAIDASPWENQALFDFQNKALPVLNVYQEGE